MANKSYHFWGFLLIYLMKYLHLVMNNWWPGGCACGAGVLEAGVRPLPAARDHRQQRPDRQQQAGFQHQGQQAHSRWGNSLAFRGAFVFRNI